MEPNIQESDERLEGEHPNSDTTLNKTKGNKPGPLSSKKDKESIAAGASQPTPSTSGEPGRADTWAKGASPQILLKGLLSSRPTKASDREVKPSQDKPTGATELSTSRPKETGMDTDPDPSQTMGGGEGKRKRKEKIIPRPVESDDDNDEDYYPPPFDSVDEEIALHLAMEAKEKINNPTSDEATVRQARRQLKGILTAREYAKSRKNTKLYNVSETGVLRRISQREEAAKTPSALSFSSLSSDEETTKVDRPRRKKTKKGSSPPYKAGDEVEESVKNASTTPATSAGTSAVSDQSDAEPNKVKRKRGRPPTTGQYVGLHKRKEMEAAFQRKKEALKVREEEEILAAMQESRAMRTAAVERLSNSATYTLDPEEGSKSQLVADLLTCIESQVSTINKVANRSTNLKGTFKRALTDAAAAIILAVKDLAARTATEEITGLRAENQTLKTKVESLSKDLEETKQMVRALQDKATSLTQQEEEERVRELERAVMPPPPPPLIRTTQARSRASSAGPDSITIQEKRITQTIITRVEQMLNARLPMQKTSSTPRGTQRPFPLEGETTAGSDGGKATASKSKTRRKGVTQPSHAREEEYPSLPPRRTAVTDTPWSEIVRKGKKKTDKKEGPTTVKAPPTSTPVRVPTKSKKGVVNPSRIRPPSTAVVSLTKLTEEKDTQPLTEAMRMVKEAINLKELGIVAVNPKKGITGSLLLEIEGENCAAKANVLAAKMKGVLDKNPNVRVGLPVKTSEVRLSGLEETTTEEEIRQAIMPFNSEGGDVTIGKIRRATRRMATVWIRCPMRTAKKMATEKRIVVGWARVKVEVLPPRPLRCFRCLELGHTRPQCKGKDRSGLCHHCSQAGHTAVECDKDPHCALCADLGRSANHVLGWKTCAPPPQRQRRNTRAAPTTAATTDEASAQRQQQEVAQPMPQRGRRKEREPSSKERSTTRETEGEMDIDPPPLSSPI